MTNTITQSPRCIRRDDDRVVERWFRFLESTKGATRGTSPSFAPTLLDSPVFSNVEDVDQLLCFRRCVSWGDDTESTTGVDGLRCFQSCNISSRLRVNDHSSLYCHLRLRGVLPVGTLSLTPLVARLYAACSMDFSLLVEFSS